MKLKNLASYRLWLAAALAGALLVAGCDSLQPRTPEEEVEQRAEQRWDALIDGDFSKAWEYTQPGYRELVKQKDYRRQFGAGGEWQDVQVHSVTCEGSRCEVRLRVNTKILMPPAAERNVVGTVDEIWVREDGQWWYYQAL